MHYFDSFENLQPPREVVKYLGHKIQCNYGRVQDFDTYNCGHLDTFFHRRCGVKTGIFKWLIYIWGVENQCRGTCICELCIV